MANRISFLKKECFIATLIGFHLGIIVACLILVILVKSNLLINLGFDRAFSTYGYMTGYVLMILVILDVVYVIYRFLFYLIKKLSNISIRK